MKKLFSIVFAACVLGCTNKETDKESKMQSASADFLAVIDGVGIGKETVEKQVEFRMGLFEVNRRLNLAMRRMNLKKVYAQQRAKFEKMAKREVIFKSLLLAAAKRAGAVARPEDLNRIRSQYEMMLGRRAGSYSSVTSVVDKVGFLNEFEQFIDDEARTLTYVCSLHPEVSLDVSEADIDAYIVKLQEKSKRVAEHNTKAYQTATNVLARLKGGEDFGKLAKEFSYAEDKEDGGDMGDIILSGESAYSNYAPAYLSALMMKDGAFSEVVTTPLGVEIFQVVASREQEKSDDPIIKNLRHICFELRPAVGEYTRDSVGRRLVSDRLQTLYGEDTVLRALDSVTVEISGVDDVKSYFVKPAQDAEEEKD